MTRSKAEKKAQKKYRAEKRKNMTISFPVDDHQIFHSAKPNDMSFAKFCMYLLEQSRKYEIERLRAKVER